jgi:hypothetical protein
VELSGWTMSVCACMQDNAPLAVWSNVVWGGVEAT